LLVDSDERGLGTSCPGQVNNGEGKAGRFRIRRKIVPSGVKQKIYGIAGFSFGTILLQMLGLPCTPQTVISYSLVLRLPEFKARGNVLLSEDIFQSTARKELYPVVGQAYFFMHMFSLGQSASTVRRPTSVQSWFKNMQI
jgi:hypothetical protein